MAHAIAKAIERFELEQNRRQGPGLHRVHIVKRQGIRGAGFPGKMWATRWPTLWDVDRLGAQWVAVVKVCLEVERSFETVNRCDHKPRNVGDCRNLFVALLIVEDFVSRGVYRGQRLRLYDAGCKEVFVLFLEFWCENDRHGGSFLEILAQQIASMKMRSQRKNVTIFLKEALIRSVIWSTESEPGAVATGSLLGKECP